jgi:hypothetical protein
MPAWSFDGPAFCQLRAGRSKFAGFNPSEWPGKNPDDKLIVTVEFVLTLLV